MLQHQKCLESNNIMINKPMSEIINKIYYLNLYTNLLKYIDSNKKNKNEVSQEFNWRLIKSRSEQ